MWVPAAFPHPVNGTRTCRARGMVRGGFWGEISSEQAAGTARMVYLLCSLFGVVSGKKGVPGAASGCKLLRVSCCGVEGKSLIARLPRSAAGKLGASEAGWSNIRTIL